MCVPFRTPILGRAVNAKLCRPEWRTVRARICHIRGLNPTSARHDPLMTDRERNAYENLIVLCPNCHDMVDELQPDRFTSEMLLDMKRRAEEHAAPVDSWATEEQLTWAAQKLEEAMERARLGTEPRLDPEIPPWDDPATPRPSNRLAGIRDSIEQAFIDDDLEDMVDGMNDGMLNPTEATTIRTRRAWQKDDVIPTRKNGHFIVLQPSQPSTNGFETAVIKLRD